MSSLLTLPLKLRDLILQIALLSSSPPPPCPIYPTARVQLHDSPGLPYFHERVQCAEPHPWTLPSCLPLLLINRQLNTETKAILARTQTQSGISYHLDIMLVNSRFLHPTWLSVPTLSNKIETLEIDIRPFDSAHTPWTHARSFRDTPTRISDAPPPIVPIIHILLQRFLKRGPSFPSPGELVRFGREAMRLALEKEDGDKDGAGDGYGFQTLTQIQTITDEDLLSDLGYAYMVVVPEKDRMRDRRTRTMSEFLKKARAAVFPDMHIVVRTVRVNCLTPSDWQGQTIADPELGFENWRTEEYFESHSSNPDPDSIPGPAPIPAIRPEWLASYIASGLRVLLEAGYANGFDSGLFYERVGRIEIAVDGDLIDVLELGEGLEGLAVEESVLRYHAGMPVGMRERDLQRWKGGRMVARSANGL